MKTIDEIIKKASKANVSVDLKLSNAISERIQKIPKFRNQLSNQESLIKAIANEEEEENETGNGSGSEQGEDGNPFPEDLIPSVIDGKTQYISMLENLKEQAGQKLLDPTLTQEQRDALNKYINNIDMELEGLK